MVGEWERGEVVSYVLSERIVYALHAVEHLLARVYAEEVPLNAFGFLNIHNFLLSI